MACVVVIGTADAGGAGPLVLTPVLSTSPLFNYEDAPAIPDADDPAIWVNRGNPRRSLVIGTAKDAGLLVYDMFGRLVQAMPPPNTPQVLPADPATPAGINLALDNPCVDSDSLETFGRFNNVDIAYDIRVGSGPRAAPTSQYTSDEIGGVLSDTVRPQPCAKPFDRHFF